MKLIVFAGLLAACTAASLEHLEKKEISYLPVVKDSSSSSSKDSDAETSLGADTNGITASSGDQQALKASSFISGASKLDTSSNKDLSPSATDSEFAGYFYGPGIQSVYNQQSSFQARSQFGIQTTNQQLDQLGANKYPNQQNRNEISRGQGLNQQLEQQHQNQQFGQQSNNLQFRQQPHNEQFSQQTQLVSQQQQNQQFRQQAHSQQFGQQSPRQQYFQQTQNQHYGNLASQVEQQNASAQGTNNFGVQVSYQPRPSFVNNQKSGSYSSQNYPQQPFDEETGYHY